MASRTQGQFKEKAMDLVRVQGGEPKTVAQELGMPHCTLLVWLKKAGWVNRHVRSAARPQHPQAFKVRVASLACRIQLHVVDADHVGFDRLRIGSSDFEAELMTPR